MNHARQLRIHWPGPMCSHICSAVAGRDDRKPLLLKVSGPIRVSPWVLHVSLMPLCLELLQRALAAAPPACISCRCTLPPYLQHTPHPALNDAAPCRMPAETCRIGERIVQTFRTDPAAAAQRTPAIAPRCWYNPCRCRPHMRSCKAPDMLCEPKQASPMPDVSRACSASV